MKHNLRNYLMLIPVIALRVPVLLLIWMMQKIGHLGDHLNRGSRGSDWLPYLEPDLEKEKARRDAYSLKMRENNGELK